MKYVLLSVAHGVEFKKIHRDYASPLIDRINSCLTKSERDHLILLPYNYTVKTNDRQMQVFGATDKGLGNEDLRRLKHTVGSDVTWSFIIAKDGKECFYTDFVSDLKAMIDACRQKYPSCKVMCVGHSQGTQLFYSFFFDYAQTVDSFVSMGSPISMNSGAYTNWGKVPSVIGSWINFYHWMDFISSRLQGCHPSKAIADFVVDYEVPSAWWKILYKLPATLCKAMLVAGLMAHVSYWKSDFVARKIADEIKRLMYLPS